MYTICNSLPERSETVSLLLFSAGTQAYLLQKKKKKKNRWNEHIYVYWLQGVHYIWFQLVQFSSGKTRLPFWAFLGKSPVIASARHSWRTQLKSAAIFFFSRMCRAGVPAELLCVDLCVCVRYEDGDEEDEEEAEG